MSKCATDFYRLSDLPFRLLDFEFGSFVVHEETLIFSISFKKYFKLNNEGKLIYL